MWTSLINLGCLSSVSLLLWAFSSPQMAAAFAYCFTCFVGMALSTSIAWFRRPPAFALPDLGHELLPEIRTIFGVEAHRICDNLLYTTAAATVGFVLGHPQRATIGRRFFVVYGTRMMLRSVTLLMTALPDPYILCREAATTTTGATSTTAATGAVWRAFPWGHAFGKFLRMFEGSANSLTCGDLIFSGHTVVFVLCALVWHTYYTPSHVFINPMKLFIWVLSIVGTLLLLITRMHWTIDIALAYYITTTMWNFYHSACHALVKGHYMKSVVWIDGVVVYPFIAWLETGVSASEFHRVNSRRNDVDLNTDTGRLATQ